MPIVSDVSELSAFIFMLTEKMTSLYGCRVNTTTRYAFSVLGLAAT